MSLNNKQSVPAKTSVSPRPRKKIKTKDSGIPWIGEIPVDWEIIPFKTVFRESKSVSEFGEEMLLSVSQYTGITPKKDSVSDREHLSRAESLAGYRIVHVDDFVMNIMLAWNGSLGISQYSGIVSPAYAVFRLIRKSHPQFLHFLLRTEAYTTYFRAFSSGIIESRLRLYPEIFLRLFCVLPPAGTQKRIAEFLDKKCAEIDALIALQEKMITELKSYKQSVITEAVTRGVPTNIKEIEISRRDAEAQSVPVKDSGSRWIGCLPKSWNIVQAKYCITINHGSDPKTDGDIPVYGSGADSFKTCGEYKNGPVVLVGRKGATLHIPHYIKGKYWNVDTAFDVATNRLCHIKYYYYLAMSFDYKYYMSQTTLPGMTQSAYKNMYIPCPPYSEQEKIVVYLEEKCTQIDQFIALKQQKIETLQNYKKSIIFENVTGKNLL